MGGRQRRPDRGGRALSPEPASTGASAAFWAFATALAGVATAVVAFLGNALSSRAKAERHLAEIEERLRTEQASWKKSLRKEFGDRISTLEERLREARRLEQRLEDRVAAAQRENADLRAWIAAVEVLLRERGITPPGLPFSQSGGANAVRAPLPPPED